MNHHSSFPRISHFATADEFTDTTIRVITIEKRQYGIFKCKAQNKLGTDEGQVDLVGKYATTFLVIIIGRFHEFSVAFKVHTKTVMSDRMATYELQNVPARRRCRLPTSR